jgi:anti-anti-sigma factor
MICMLDTIDWPVAFLGAIKAGVVPVAVNTLLKPQDYLYMLRDSRVRVLFLSQALAAGKTALLLDFGHLDFISSAGLRVLVMIGKRLSAGRGTMALCGMNPSVRKIFDVSGFANLFPIHADAASAVQALAVGARAAQVSGFASDLIGGKEVERPPERGKLGDRADRASLAADAQLPAAGSGFAGFTLAQNVATRQAVDEALGCALAAGGTILKQAQEVFWGGYSGYFADPDGFAWEVAWNPHFTLTTSGLVELPE